MRLLLCLLIGLAVGCSQAAAPDRDSPLVEHVWVEQSFNNGDSGNFTGPDPPNTVTLLREVGVVARRVFVEELPRCMGPGCPTYAARHFALIPARDLARAGNIGFKKSDGPSS